MASQIEKLNKNNFQKKIRNMGDNDAIFATLDQVNNVIDSVNDVLDGVLYQGVINCSTNPNYPTAIQDQFWSVSVAGKIGGASGIAVEVGDLITCITTNSGGDEATVGTYFVITQKNMIPCDVAVLRTGTNNTDFVTAKTLKDQGITTAAATIVALAGGTTEQLLLTSTAAQKALTISSTAQTSDAITATITVNSTNFNFISAGITPSTALSGGELITGTNISLTSLATDADGSLYKGHKINLINTGGVASYCDMIGIDIVHSGTITNTANTVNNIGINIAPTFTLNTGGGTVNYYGLNIDLTGITNTVSNNVYGLRILTNGLADSCAYFADAARSVYLCDNTYAIYVSGTIAAATSTNLVLNTITDTNTVRLNSRNYAATTGNIIGFQSKPAANASGTQTVYGGQISPRFNDNIDGVALVGLQVEPILKGATVLALTGDMRGIDVRLTSEGANTVGGITGGAFFYNELPASTYTGGVYPIVVKANGSTQAWTGLMEIPTIITGAANGGGADVYINFTINGVPARLTAKYVS